MALLARGKDVDEGKNVLQIRGGAMSTKMVYGNDCNMMVAVRAPGYHSNPHTHDCEQINYVLEGEVWVFVDNDAFLMKTGDFSRIPRNAVHWAWNRCDKPVTLVECTHRPAIRWCARTRSVSTPKAKRPIFRPRSTRSARTTARTKSKREFSAKIFEGI